MDTFHVLAEPRRRTLVELLARRGEMSASQIYEEFDVTPQAISQHLKVLREAKIVQMEKRAQRRLYSFNPRAMDEIREWTADMARLWARHLDRVDKALKEGAE
jgi:DNA-binding transcriptional ArsR family regulator